MKRYLVSLMIIIILLGSMVTVTYAWFTYVERKSLATFQTGQIAITTHMNDQLVISNFELNDLAYLSFHQDIILNETNTFNEMVSVLQITLKNNEKSPLTKNKITFLKDNLPSGLICFIVYDGMNLENDISHDYYQILNQIINGHLSKIEAYEMINTYNLTVLDDIYELIMKENDTLKFKIIYFGDYDMANNSEGYLNQSYNITLIIDTINAKGEVN